MILLYTYLIGYLKRSAAVQWTKAYILELPCYSAMLNWGEGELSLVVAHPKKCSHAVCGNMERIQYTIKTCEGEKLITLRFEVW